MGGVWNSFEKGTKTIGTWFGLSKDKTGHTLHKLYGSPDPYKQKAERATKNLMDASNALYATNRQRQRASALSTGAGDERRGHDHLCDGVRQVHAGRLMHGTTPPTCAGSKR
jgi:hypothetical protein